MRSAPPREGLPARDRPTLSRAARIVRLDRAEARGRPFHPRRALQPARPGFRPRCGPRRRRGSSPRAAARGCAPRSRARGRSPTPVKLPANVYLEPGQAKTPAHAAAVENAEAQNWLQTTGR